MTRVDAPFPVLVLAGLDPSGGAGLGGDVRVLHSLGCHPLPVATCLTVQSRLAFRLCQGVAAELLTAMTAAAVEHLPPRAVKIGLLADPGQVATLAAVLPPGVPRVLDPVLQPTLAAAGKAGLGAALVETLIPTGVIVTPNRPELFALAGLPETARTAAAAEILLAAGAAAVVVKGGHGGSGDKVVNLLYTPDGRVVSCTSRRRSAGEVHGTGCAFSAALAGLLARGEELPGAAAAATDLVGRLVAASWSAGPGPGVLGF